MALIWSTHHIVPLPIGGAAKLRARVSDPVDGLRAILAPTAATDANIIPVDGVVVDLGLDAGRWHSTVWDAHGALKCAWFALNGTTWEAGPVDDVALPFSMAARFPVPLDWIVNRLTDYAVAAPPLTSKPFSVSTSYPRNVSAWPMASVQLDDISQGDRVVTNLLDSSIQSFGSAYTASFSITCWCATPEERRVISPWLAGAMEALRHCAKDHPDLYDPSISLSEAEDFQTLEVPAFIVTGRLSATVFSALAIPPVQTYGPVTVP